MAYGEFIKKHRIASGYKRQLMLAGISGISTATISRIEKEIQKPEVKTLKALAPYLYSTSFEELMSVCGYSDEKMNDEKIIDLTNLFNVKLCIDHVTLSEEELKFVIENVRLLRRFKSK